MITKILPEAFNNYPKVICVMIYDWESLVRSELLDTIEKMFSDFNLTPYEGTGGLGRMHSHGSYKRVRKKLATFLDGNLDENEFRDIRVVSENIYDDEPFCPSKFGVVWSSGARKNKKAMFYIREDAITDSISFIQYIERNVFSLVGEFYGGVMELPTALGPSFYLSSIMTLPDLLDHKSNCDYQQRLTRWRDNLYGGGWPSLGYFREIYPINYVNNNHLKALFLGKPLKIFMEENGVLVQAEFNANMYRWDIPQSKYEYVREALELSGLVLSSSRSRH